MVCDYVVFHARRKMIGRDGKVGKELGREEGRRRRRGRRREIRGKREKGGCSGTGISFLVFLSFGDIPVCLTSIAK